MKLRTWCIRIGQILTKTGSVLSVALLLMCLLCFADGVYAESDEQGITLRQQNASIEKVFQAIEKQSGYRFFYNETLIEGATKVSLNLQNVSLEEALNACLKNQPFTYAIVEKTIIIKRRVVAAVTRTANAPMNKIIAVRGKVTSGGKVVVDATVAVKGTSNATSTDSEGMFTLSEVDDQGVLVVSHVNHQEREVRLDGKSFVAVDLDEKVGDLDEAVVVAYNTTTVKRNTAAVSVVKGEQIASLPSRSVDKSLQGLVPGLLVTSGNGQPGSGLSNFVLRGIATGGNVTGSSTTRNPLIVMDGVPVTQDNLQFRSGLEDVPVINPMAQINPSDIESITILKDAAAIALYGSKASNGVILLTTKRGKAGKTVINFRHQTDFSNRLEGDVKLLNKEEYLDLLYETYRNTDASKWTDSAILKDLKSRFPTRSDGSFYPETNWPNEIYDNSASTIANEISFSGGNERNNFYLNLEYVKQNGVAKKTGYNRKSIRFNFENRPATWLKLGVNTLLSYNIQDYATLVGSFPTGTVMFLSPLNPVYDEDGEYILNYKTPQVSNPVAARDFNINRNTSFRGLTKLYGELSFLKYFKFTSNIGADFMLLEAKEKVDPRLFDGVTFSTGSGRIQESNTRNANFIATNILHFDKVIRDDHSINILLGHEAQMLNQKLLMATARNLRFFNNDQISNGNTKTADGGTSRQTLLSYFAQVNYGFQSKYFISSSIRTDGASRFGSNEQFGTYWSTGLGWIVSSESFLKGASSWLGYLKLRGSIGAAGNSSPIDLTTRYDQLNIGAYLNAPAVYPGYSPGNLNIRPEETFNWDGGLEARLFKDRFSVTVDIYKRKTYDVIYTTNLPLGTGYVTMLDNIGNMENKGVELSLSIDVLKTSNFTWNINANWSTNKNVLVKANVPLETVAGAVANEEGRNFNSFYLVRWAGVDPANGNALWIDSTGKPNSDYYAAKREFVGKPQPDGFGAVTNTFKIRNFQLSVLFYYQYGFQLLNGFTLTNDGSSPFHNQDRRALDRWQKPGDIATNPKRSLFNFNGSLSSDRYLYSGDYIRLQNVSLSYNVPRKISNLIHFVNLRAYIQAHNLAVWSKFPGGDPSNVGVQGGVNLVYPNQRSFSIGLNASL